jgi:hypothetical protein
VFGTQPSTFSIASIRIISNNEGFKPNESSEERPDYLSLCLALKEDLLPCPSKGQFIQYNHGTIGHRKEGGLIIHDEEGILIIEADTDMDKEIEEVLQELAHTHQRVPPRRTPEDQAWLAISQRATQGAIGLELNTMHKTKDKKVLPVSDSLHAPHPVEGRQDWRERAQARQPANSDQSWRQFPDSIEDRTAPFPRGTRVTKERLAKMKVADWLWPREIDMLKEVFYCREAALSFDFAESGRIHEDVCPPIRINTVPHKAWREGNFPVPRRLRAEVHDMIQQRVDRGVLEYSKSPYSNPWFLVKKKDQGYRLINNAQKGNRVTIRDANMPPNADEFSEEFAGCQVVSLIDFFSGYDQVSLHTDSRPMTAFFTPSHGLVQQCTLPMGTTNSVAEFVRVVTKILQDLIPHRCMPYMDDIAVKGPKDAYHGALMEQGVRRFIGEHIVNIDKVLRNLELAGATASGFKSDWCYDSLGIVGYVVDKEGRHPAPKKVSKISQWPPCTSPRDVRMFLGVCVYYRCWIQDFARHAAPLFNLLRKEADFQWSIEAEKSMEYLKRSITTAPALVSIDYSEPIRPIVISVDGSKKGWGAVLQQEDSNGQKRPVRFESGVWSTAERNWDSGKHECKAMLLALKKFRPWIYGVHFVVETDARTLVDQLNRSATDLPGALVTRWLALLNMWEFEVRHIEGKKNVVADALSRRPEQPDWEPPSQPEEDVEEFIDKQLGSMRLANPGPMDPGSLQYATQSQAFDLTVLETLATQHFRNIAQWLVTMKNPRSLNRKEMRQLRRQAGKYLVERGMLWARAGPGRPLRRVVDDPDQQEEILRRMHDESGHRGREGTWRKTWTRYYWNNMFKDVEQYVRTCKQCQIHSTQRFDEELHPTRGPNAPWTWITMDVVHMPNGVGGKRYMVVARDYLSGYVEARALPDNNSGQVSKFLEEVVFARWGLPIKLTVDGGPENKGLTKDLTTLYRTRMIVASAFNPHAQGLIERGHKELVGALKKMKGNWVTNLHLALWADRVTVKRSTGETPAYLICGQEHVLPVDLSIGTWQTLPWNEVHDTETLLALRAKQFEHRDDRLKEAVDRTMRLREEGKEWFDNKASLRSAPMTPGDLVLVRDVIRDLDMSRSRKMDPRWKGPFRIKYVSEKATYILEELDGCELRRTYAGNRLKKFYQRAALDRETILAQDEAQVVPMEESTPALIKPTTGPTPVVRIPKTDIDRSQYEWFGDEEDDIREL